MPLTFPGHQGLILPIMRKYPYSFDVLALSVGAAMPDIADSVLGFLFNGYFMQWYGHSLIGAALLDFPFGLILTYLLMFFAKRHFPAMGKSRAQLNTWSLSMLVGILSHLAFDFISHENSWLFYPWYQSGKYLPAWWYVTWFQIHPPPIFPNSYSVGPHSVIWIILSVIGVILFFQHSNLKGKTNQRVE